MLLSDTVRPPPWGPTTTWLPTSRTSAALLPVALGWWASCVAIANRFLETQRTARAASRGLWGLSAEEICLRHQRIIEASSTEAADGLLEGVDLLLLTPGLKPNVRAQFLDAVRSNPKAADIPTRPLSATLNVALVDERLPTDLVYNRG